MKARRKARAIALQAIYELDCAAHVVDDVIAERLAEQPLSDEGCEFARQLIQGVITHKAVLDQLIHQHAPEWPLDQMALIDHNILRMAIWEFAAGATPLKVAINEAVEMAKLFGAESAPRFVNGVLGALALRETELIQAFAAATLAAAQ